MEKCELYSQGLAFIYEQVGNDKITACPYTDEICPYNQKGKKFRSSENGIEYSICNSNGLIKKSGLINKL